MDLLLANDDGIDAPGLTALRDSLEGLGQLWTVAPESPASAKSHSLTLHKPLRFIERGDHAWAISGTPADCVYVGLHHLLPQRPALVVSGINKGANVGTDVMYSGTVGAASEACGAGVASIAFSLSTDLHRGEAQWAAAGAIAKQIVARALATPLPASIVLNVNIPNLPLAEIKGMRACPMGMRKYVDEVDVRTDPRGRSYAWIGGHHDHFGGDESSDGPSLEAGWVTVTALQLDRTSTTVQPELQAWLNDKR